MIAGLKMERVRDSAVNPEQKKRRLSRSKYRVKP